MPSVTGRTSAAKGPAAERKMTKSCCVWDITIKCEGNPHPFILELCRKLAKKWSFQKEQGEGTGYLHWQLRLSLYKKKTFDALKDLLNKEDLEGYHLTPSSTNSLKGESFYTVKEDTRVEGPWTDRDETPRSLKTCTKMETSGLHPWQAKLLDLVKDYDDRSIHVVIDKQGNSGKSALCKWVWVNRLGQPVPSMTSAEDLVQFVMCMPESQLYIIDMPRAQKKKSLYGMYSGMENLKNGLLYDKRYKGQFKYINEPNIIVFTNTAPKLRYLSQDRWKLWTIKDNHLEVFKFDKKKEEVHVGEDPRPDQEQA